MENKIPRLVAHRGYMLHYPENTLIALEAALRAGACAVEFDIHLSKDGVPVMIHDIDLARTAGLDRFVYDLTAGELQQVSVHEPERLGDRFQGENVATLSQVLDLLRRWPRAIAFVEIKRKSLQHFGHEQVVNSIMNLLSPLLERCVPISFDALAVRMARDRGAPAIGWVTETWDDEAHALARDLAPQYLFAEDSCFAENQEPLPAGPWQWVIYDVTAPEQAMAFAARGVSWVETKAIGEMLQDPQLSKRRCG